MNIESLIQQTDDLKWLNVENEQRYAGMVDKYTLKKRKIKDERIRLNHEMHVQRTTYENYINNLKNVMQRDYEKFA